MVAKKAMVFTTEMLKHPLTRFTCSGQVEEKEEGLILGQAEQGGGWLELHVTPGKDPESSRSSRHSGRS